MGDSFRDKDCLSQIASVKDVLKDIMGNAGKLSTTTSITTWGGIARQNDPGKEKKIDK